MAMIRCFSLLPARKDKNKVNEKSSKEDFNTLLAKLQASTISSVTHDLESVNFDVAVPNGIQKNPRFNARAMSLESPVKTEVEEAYKGEDENEDLPLIEGELSDFDLQGLQTVASKEECDATDKDVKYPISDGNQANNELEDKSDRYSQKSVDTTQSGHVSDPGIDKADLWASPKFKRYCSNLEKLDVNKKITHHLPPLKSQSFEDFQESSEIVNLESPRSGKSHYSADRVMLKRHSSSQVLPSGSKKLWWKMILWSHRNIHRKLSSKSTLAPAQCGYTSDTLEPKQGKALRHVKPSESVTMESFNKSSISKNIDNERGSRFQNENSSFWPQNQWIAFSADSSPFARVDAWVKNLEIQQSLPEDDFDDDNTTSIVFPPSPDAGRSTIRTTSQLTYPAANANSVVQTLNPASTIAHISGIGIKAIPAISHLSNLRCVNLSNNFIVHISPGFLPKGIQTLHLSRNKISTVDGLRELTRLRVLDLSYNRISRIGQGLSSCTLIKELYLAGNKISDVEGLHRLLKLTVLDLSFNKITTTKALGQLVANFNSLQALNLLGNPIQSNISDDQLNKAVCGLLPRLVYLNKQPLKAQRAREIFSDSVARAALGNSKRGSDRRSLRRVSHGGSSFSRGYRRTENGHTFPTLKLRYKPSLVQFEGGISNLPLLDPSMRAIPLSPSEWRDRLEAINKIDLTSKDYPNRNYILLDVRNGYEWDIGHFRGAQRPNVDCFRSTSFGLSQEEIAASDPLSNVDKEKANILMYCTGGIRCDVYSTILRQQGFQNLYTLKGGVSHYLKNEGPAEWIGNLFVFDSRLSLPPSIYYPRPTAEAESVPVSGDKFAKCYVCSLKVSELRHRNCANLDCNLLFLSCKKCVKALRGCCCYTCIAAPRLRPVLNGRQRYRKWHIYRDMDLQDKTKIST